MKYLYHVVFISSLISTTSYGNSFGIGMNWLGLVSSQGLMSSANGFKYESGKIGLGLDPNCELPGLPKIDFTKHNTKSCFPSEKYTKDLGFGLSVPSFEYLTLSQDDNVSAFKKQQEICDCINTNLKDEDNLANKDILNSEEYALVHLENMMKGFTDRSHYTHNMMILHAQSLGGDAALAYGLDKPVNIHQRYRDFVSNIIDKNIKNGLNIPPERVPAFDAKVKDIMTQAYSEKRGSVLDLLGKKEAKGELCYPMKQYLLVKSFPVDDAFWGVFKKDFSEKDWNISELKSSLIKEKDDTKKAAIQARIEFLEKNPFVKLALNSKDPNAARKVYGVMKKHMGSLPRNCSDIEFQGCHKQFVEKSLAKYQKEVMSVFQDPEMQKLIMKERAAEAEKHIGDLLNSSEEKLNITSLNNWGKTINNAGLDLEACGKHFMNNPLMAPHEGTAVDLTGIDLTYYEIDLKSAISGSSSNKGDQNILDDNKTYNCLKFLPAYCGSVGAGPSSVLAKGGNLSEVVGNKKRLDDLYMRVQREMDPDPGKNEDYQAIAQDLCNNDFRTYRGESVNFDGYKSMFCKNGANREICSDKEKLYASFTNLRRDDYLSSSYSSNTPFANYFNNPAQISSLSDTAIQSFVTNGSGGTSDALFSKPETNDSSVKPNVVSDSFQFVSSNETTSLTSEMPIVNNASNFSQPIVGGMTSNIQNSLRESKEELDEEIRATKEAISYNKERLSRPNTTPQFRSEIDERVRSLEMLLAEKEKSAQQYQELINKLLDQKQGASPTVAQADSFDPGSSQIAKDESQRVASSSTVRNTVPSVKNNELNEDISRTPASISENFSTSGGVKGGASIGGSSLGASSAAGSRSRGTVNSALLSKYGITVQENDQSVQVAPDKERREISQLLTNASKADVGIEVSKTEYDQFRNNDLNALNRLYEERLKSIETDVVKLLIHADGVDESLEFYAIKEDGKVVFQPVRKNTLKDLQNALTN